MGADSKIEWTTHTFNPWTGCTKVSPGCDHCYAEGWAKRSGHVQWGPGAERRRTSAANWNLPLKWSHDTAVSNRARASYGMDPIRPRVFCASLADVFDNEVPPEWRADLFALIQQTPHLDWLLLTKRIGNVHSMLNQTRRVVSFDDDRDLWLWLKAWENDEEVPHNVWLGASIVNQDEADRDIPKLLAVPAAKRFLSMEPLLGPVDLRALRVGDRLTLDALTGCHCGTAGPGTVEECLALLPRLPGSLPPVDWVIVGGESGPNARPMHPDWARSLRNQCTTAGVPFHFKQWGEWAPAQVIAGGDLGGELRRGTVQHLHAPGNLEGHFSRGDAYVRRVGKKTAGRLLDGRTWDEVPG